MHGQYAAALRNGVRLRALPEPIVYIQILYLLLPV
jgi:hypothetical protein